MHLPAQILMLAAAIALVPAALAQQSASFRLTESAINSGGSPANGATAASASFRIGQDAIGDAALDKGLSSASFQVEGGFVAAFLPVGEILDLAFTSPSDLGWSPAPSALSYNVYRDTLSQLTGLGYALCVAPDLTSNAWQDATLPPAGDAFFYLITGSNRLAREGTKGAASAGNERLGNQCP